MKEIEKRYCNDCEYQLKQEGNLNHCEKSPKENYSGDLDIDSHHACLSINLHGYCKKFKNRGD